MARSADAAADHAVRRQAAAMAGGDAADAQHRRRGAADGGVMSFCIGYVLGTAERGGITPIQARCSSWSISSRLQLHREARRAHHRHRGERANGVGYFGGVGTMVVTEEIDALRGHGARSGRVHARAESTSGA
jgi:hypothetical protein